MRLWWGQALAVLVLAWSVAAGAQAAEQKEQDDIEALDAEVIRLYEAGQYAEAVPIAERVLAMREKELGPEHSKVATALNNLAALYNNLVRYADAEPLYKRALAIDERALGPDHPGIAAALNNLAELYRRQNRFVDAVPLYERAIAIREKALGPDHPEVGKSLNNLAVLYFNQGRFSEAEQLYKRVLVISETDSDDTSLGRSLSNLAVLYDAQGRYGEAEPLYERALAIYEKMLGPDHPQIAYPINNLAVLYVNMGRYPDAERLYKRALAIREKALGPDHIDTAETLNKLAELYSAQSRFSDAEHLYNRALAIREKMLGPDHSDVGQSLNNIATLYGKMGRFADAEPLYKRAIAIREKALGPDHPAIGTLLNNLARLYEYLGRYADAEPLHKRALSLWEKALGPDHPDVGRSLNNLAGLYTYQGRYAEAEPLYRRSLGVWKNALGPDHPDVAASLNNLAGLALAQRNWAQAADYWRGSTGVIRRRAERGLADGEREGSGREALRWSSQFHGLVKVTHLLAAEGHGEREKLSQEMFETAQWAQGSEAAASLAQMAARSAKGDSALAALVRERQDLVGEWQAKDRQLIAARSRAPDRRNAETEKALAGRLATIDGRLAEIDARLATDFPDYAALANPKPLSLAEVQGELGDDEALVLFLDTDNRFNPVPEETFIWVVTKPDSRWVRSDLGTKALTERVQALRCGLDQDEWWGLEEANRCGSLLNIGQPDLSDPLPFNLEIAHELYQALFGQFEDLIKGKRLLIIPSGPLTSLPFHVLTTKKPETALSKTFAGYRTIAWLARENAITVLPSVSSLKALREFAKGSPSPKAYIGYGNPVLEGSADCKEVKAPEKCPSVEVSSTELRHAALAEGPVRATVRGRAGRRSADLGKVFAKGGGTEAVLAQVRALCPLPDTAYEIICVAEGLGVPKSEIRLDVAATEADLKALSESGALASHRVVHFATHGLLAGDVEEMAKKQGEPALVLTPPKEPKDADDNGLLTASEVTQLKLNADWIVLSACNTASGDKLGAEALSGLAQAFFYAGARALLVSHWPVYSDAAVRLTTRAFLEMEQDKTVGRADALQRAMIALMDDPSQNDNGHPSVWGPFVVVGEGAR